MSKSYVNMGDESDDVSETSSQKQSYIDVNIANKNEKGFSCCSRKCGIVICAFCEKIMHKSCAKKMEHIKFIDGFHMNCCNSEETIEISLRKSEEETVSSLGFLERKLLETKNQFLVQLLESANEKNEILKLNNALLLQRIQDIELKTNVPQKNANNYHEPVDNNFHHKVAIPVIKIDNLTDCSPAAVTNDPRNMMLTENIPSASSATGNPPSKSSKRKISNLSNQALSYKNDHGMQLDQTVNSHIEKPIEQIKEPEKLSWTQVVKKKPVKQKPKSSLLCTGSRQVNPESKIKGAQRRKWLYVGKIYGPHVTEDDVKDFLKDSTNQNNFEVRKLPTRGNNSAFSVGVPSDALYLELSKPALWPSGVVLREFNFRNFFRKDPISDAIVK